MCHKQSYEDFDVCLKSMQHLNRKLGFSLTKIYWCKKHKAWHHTSKGK